MKRKLQHAAWRVSFETTKAMFALGFRFRRHFIGKVLLDVSDSIRARRVDRLIERINRGLDNAE